jgi:hypothetical protein
MALLAEASGNAVLLFRASPLQLSRRGGARGRRRQVLIVLSSNMYCIFPACISADANMAQMRRMQDVEPCTADNLVVSDLISVRPG